MDTNEDIILGILFMGIIACIFGFAWDYHPEVLHVQSPWFEQIVNGEKTIVACVGPLSYYKKLVNQVITVRNYRRNTYINVQIIAVQHFDTLIEYISAVGWKNCAPRAVDFDDAVHKYRMTRTGYTNHPPHGTLVFSNENIQWSGGINALTIIPV